MIGVRGLLSRFFFLIRPEIFILNTVMMTFILWLLLLFLCWPLALIALVLYPFIWLLLLPLRLIGIAVDGILDTVSAVIKLPSRILKKRKA